MDPVSTVAPAPTTATPVPPGTGPGGPRPGAAPLPSLQAILDKRARGEPLTNREKGRLSWFNRQGVPPTQPAGPAAPAGGPPVAGVAPGQAEGDGLPVPPADASLVRGTVESVLGALDGIRRGLVSQSMARLGADPATVEKFAARAGVQPAAKAVMVETSPAVASSLGVNANNVPVAAFLSALAADLGGFALLIAEVRKLGDELRSLPPTTQGTVHKGQPIPAAGTNPHTVAT